MIQDNGYLLNNIKIDNIIMYIIINVPGLYKAKLWILFFYLNVHVWVKKL